MCTAALSQLLLHNFDFYLIFMTFHLANKMFYFIILTFYAVTMTYPDVLSLFFFFFTAGNGFP